MKTLILLLASVFTYHLSNAQCPQKLLLKFDQVIEIRDSVQNSIKSGGTISFTKEKILIMIAVNGVERTIESTIDAVPECCWDSKLKNGKSNYQLLSSKNPDDPKDKTSLTLTGENGKLVVTFRPPGAALQFLISEFKIIE